MKKELIGIWLDLKEATIVKLDGDTEKLEQVNSEIEDFHPKGGSRSKQAYGPMEKVSEKKYLQRRKQQMKAYFKTIKAHLMEAKEVFIFGPAETKDHFFKDLEEDNTVQFTIKGVERADSMTQNQKVAKVKAVFGI